jgi:hypothetical protein
MTDPKTKVDIQKLYENLKGALGPAADLLDDLIGQSGTTPGLSDSWAEWASASLFTARLGAWEESFDNFRKAYNKHIEDSGALLSALDKRLEKDSSLTREQRDALVSFRVTLQNVADNPPIEKANYDEEPEEECCCAAGCNCKK